MNIQKKLLGMFIAVAVMALFGCGGGGGGGGAAAAPPTTATLKLSTAGTAGTPIRGIEITVVLPKGVTVNATTTIDPTVMETNAGVVLLSGATVADPAAFSQLKPTAVYTPAIGTAPGKVKIGLAAQKDFNLGEFVTFNAVIAAGNVPVATDFSLEGFTAFDSNGAPITPALTPSFTADIR
jgi:hypothetical protein